MNRTILAGALLIAGAAVTLGLSATPAPAPAVSSAPLSAEGGTFSVDAVHSSVVFKIRHMGVANFMGTFDAIEGGVTYDPAAAEQASFELKIPVTSIDTNSKSRDGHLKSPDFFNVAEHPDLTFKSTRVEAQSPERLRVTGNLTVHGVTKSVTTDMTLIGMAETRQGYKCGWDTTFTIKRSEFGMTTYVEGGALGDDVTIMVSLECVRKPAS